jgi:hypothetical protein
MDRKYIGTHLKNYLLHESDEFDEFLSSVKDNLVSAKNEFKSFLDKVTNNEIDGVDKEDVATSLKTSATGSRLLQDTAFKARLGEVARNIGVPPTALVRVMNKESRMNPHAVNAKTNATGLIQFMPSTAKMLGTTVEDLKKMSALEQLDYVEKYYLPYKGKVHNYEDLYMATFFPAALGKSKDTVMRTKNLSAETISSQNPVIARAAGKQPGEPLTVQDFLTYAKAA